MAEEIGFADIDAEEEDWWIGEGGGSFYQGFVCPSGHSKLSQGGRVAVS